MRGVSAAWALTCLQGLLLLSGCGGSSGGSSTPPAASAITSFNANPATIEAGSSTSLTAVFSSGTGVITPGNLTVTSGTPVTVTPAASTTYTLTVTGSSGTWAQTTVVTVDPVPAISTFSVSPNPVVAGSSASLIAIFSGGTGVVTPGNIALTSGTVAYVSPTTTTTYTLTVTPPVGTVTATQTATLTVQTGITVDLNSRGPAVSNQLMGMNMAVFYDIDANETAIVNAFQTAGIAAVRWPGGQASDDYHWQTNTECNSGYTNPNDTYANFIGDLEIPAGLDVALTADYGTNASCNGGGEPSEAASWVSYALAHGGTVSHVTVGNEEYGDWEDDMHAIPHDPATYASAVAGASGYYASIKAVSPNTLVGVEVNAGCTAANGCTAGWDSTVLANAKGYYDFVEYHYYPEQPGQESDLYLVENAAQGLTTNIDTIKSELAAAGAANTPIYVGEIGSVTSDPGKQSWSITQGLFAGQALGEMMNDGVARATWWMGFGDCNGSAGNLSGSLYGWQNFGAYNVFSDGSTDTNPACPGDGPIGTLSPTAQAFNLFQHVAVNGENVLNATVLGDTTDVRAYAATHSGGTALVLFNLNETAAQTVSVNLSGQSASSDVTVMTYDKAIYDQSQNDVWAGPATTDLGTQALPMRLTLAPWSMNVVMVK